MVASVNTQGVATVSWSPPSSTGYYTGPGALQTYQVRVDSNEVYESYASNSFPSPIAPVGSSSTGWTYVGGNWFSLLPKIGPNGGTGQDPVTLACCSASPAAAIVDGVDEMKQALETVASDAGCDLAYREIDPDVFGEELDRPNYRDVERIAVVAALMGALLGGMMSL